MAWAFFILCKKDIKMSVKDIPFDLTKSWFSTKKIIWSTEMKTVFKRLFDSLFTVVKENEENEACQNLWFMDHCGIV